MKNLGSTVAVAYHFVLFFVSSADANDDLFTILEGGDRVLTDLRNITGGCLTDQFFCDGDDGRGRCIPRKWVCDHEPDCHDHTDEHDGCPPPACSASQFSCRLTGRCIPLGYRCDQEVDCGIAVDGRLDDSDEDERNCKVSHNCAPNQHKCLTVNECVHLPLFCDGHFGDCSDGSDEGEFCGNAEPSKTDCSYGGSLTPDSGLRCYCAEGLRPNGTDCVDENECLWVENGVVPPCQQICRNVPKSHGSDAFKCSCVEGYTAVGDKCKAKNDPEGAEMSFLISNDHYLMHKNLFLNESLHSLMSYSLRAFDFDYRNRTVCFAHTIVHNHVPRRVMKCVPVNSTTGVFLSESAYILTPEFDIEGVSQTALDWVSGNWYFLDDAFDRIFVCNPQMSVCHNLVVDLLDKARDLALDPAAGYLFATDWGNKHPGVVRVGLDGSDPVWLVDNGVIHPNGLALDYPTRTVYWLDAYLEYIHAIDYDGKFKRRQVAKGHDIKSLLSLTVFEGWLYASDQFRQRILAFDQFNGSNTKTYIDRTDFQRVNTIRVFHKQRQPQSSHPCARDSGGCSDLCLISYEPKSQTPRAKCVCQQGFRLQPDNRTCVMPGLNEPTVVFGKTQPGTIGFLPLQPNATYEMIRPIRSLKRPTALALLSAQNKIFFSDAGNFTIQIEELPKSESDRITRTTIVDTEVNNCEGLTVDWMAGNLYWSDEGLSHIAVAKISNSSLRKIIVNDTLSHVRALAVHPARGFLFWTDWVEGTGATIINGNDSNAAKLERSALDGSERTVILSDRIHWPNGLSIDFKSDRLYWCDAFYDWIVSADLDGSHRKVIVDSAHVFHPYGIAYHKGFVYWTEFRRSVIMRAQVDGSPEPIVMHVDSSALFELQIMDKTIQTGTNACTDNTKCQQFCFFVNGRDKCDCADGFVTDPEDDAKCKLDKEYMKGRRCEFDWQFECRRNKRCIDAKYLCDGDDDCGDGSDEDNRKHGICHNSTCSDEDQYRCGDNRCITKQWLCDGDQDCTTGEDERVENCPAHGAKCGKDKFKCKITGKCISNSWLCDHELDCGKNDRSDEEHCVYPECGPGQYRCLNRQCISESFVCDGDADCRDGSDENHCSAECVKGLEFQCEAGGPCLNKLYRCDGVIDCPDASDESPDVCHDALHSCPLVHQFRCNTTGQCIRESFHCDGEADCMDGSDEADCGPLSCSVDQVACPDASRCIPKTWMCDGFEDCVDGSDELNCTSIALEMHKCVAPLVACFNSSGCISLDQLCDGKKDCEDGSDEGLSCDVKMCDDAKMAEKTLCDHDCHNTPDGYSCSCREGYFLQADRSTCEKKNPCNEWGVCSQFCQSQGIHYFCHCVQGYQLAMDKFTCKAADAVKPYLIFSNRHELRLAGLTDDTSSSLVVNLRNSIAIDFFYQRANESLIFWTDIAADKIFKGTLSNRVVVKVDPIVEHGIATAEGIAVDWIGANLYWLDSSLDQIEVAKFDGSLRATVISGQMENLRALALDPRAGLMFWTDWQESYPRIERATLAGEDRRVIYSVVHVSNGGWPNGLTVDYVNERLYWIDAKSDSIHTIKYDGAEHHEILREHEFLSHPFAITLFENDVYWTDWRVNSIIKANKFNGTDNVKIVQGTSAQPFDIKVLHPSRQPRSPKNPCAQPDNGGCSHLCLLNGTNSRICKCPYLMRLQSDAVSCEEMKEALLYARPMAIVGIEMSLPHPSFMPVITNQFVENVSVLDIDVQSKTIFWVDATSNAIFGAKLNGSELITVADSEMHNVDGLAIDWMRQNIYFSSWKEPTTYSGEQPTVSVCDFEGQYRRVILNQTDGLLRPFLLAIDPQSGKLYIFDQGTDTDGRNITLFVSNLDGTQVETVDLRDEIIGAPCSVAIDSMMRRLYWLDRMSVNVTVLDLDTRAPHPVVLPQGVRPSLIAVSSVQTGGWLILFDESRPDQGYIGKVKLNNHKADGEVMVLRNASRITYLRIFDPDLQNAEKPSQCASKNCEHLCVAGDDGRDTCLCAAGFDVSDADDGCEAVDQFILYSDYSHITGLPPDYIHQQQVLAPISKTRSPLSVDFYAKNEQILWIDGEANQIVSINRDLSNRTVLVDGGIAKLQSIAVDWIAGNLYWTAKLKTSKKSAGVIEVSRLNGDHRHSIQVPGKSAPKHIVIDPRDGYLFWSNSTGVQRSSLDGSSVVQIVSGSNISDVTLDSRTRTICWLLRNHTKLNCSDYKGGNMVELYDYRGPLSDITSFAVNNKIAYWYDRKFQDGTIHEAAVREDGHVDNFHQMRQHKMFTVVTDLRIYDSGSQDGTNLCAKDNGGCEHLCLFTPPNVTCKCSFARVASDGKSCVAFDAFLAYSTARTIDFATLTESGSDQNRPYPVIDNQTWVRNAVGITQDYRNKRIFYSDIHVGRIIAVQYDNLTTGTQPNYVEIVVGLGSLEGLAYDRVHGDLYWTSYSNSSISRANVDPKVKFPVRPTTVVRLSENDKPRGIAIDPCDMRLYWTNWNEQAPAIQRSFLSGYKRETIISSNIRTPNAIAIDFKARKLYWSDARLDKIERCEMDGSKRVMVMQGKPSHPFGLAVYEDHLYITDWVLRAVVRVNKFTGGDLVTVRSSFARQPMGVVVVAADAMKCGVDACSQLQLGCQDKCSLTEAGAPFCECFGQRVLNADGSSCNEPEARCTDDEFSCASGRCIPYEFACDASKDCPDGDDEQESLCADRKCRSGYFLCSSGLCLKEERRCNGINDCGDFTDEMNCQCDQDTQFKCSNGACISKEKRCNHENDCRDASDEMGCELRDCSKMRKLEGRTWINCGRTTQCIAPQWLCDDHNDCWDNWDEENCTVHIASPIDRTECSPDQFKCALSGKCIRASWRCDQDRDCVDGSDELDCPERTCDPDTEFTCASDQSCISLHWKCDSMQDCADGSDEEGCGAAESCQEGDFKCPVDGHCISSKWLCDGENDCSDGKDEQKCDLTVNLCETKEFQCDNKRCILATFFCDGDDDCGDGSDEPQGCRRRVCGSDEFECPNKTCIPESWTCNNMLDCSDGSDEAPELCSTDPHCKDDEFMCDNEVCLAQELLCDKTNDCGDWSDEKKCGVNECESNAPCQHSCKDLKIGYECQCNEGYKLADDEHKCVDLDECSESFPCSQHCFNRIGSFECSCAPGYELSDDGSGCKHASQVEPLLLVSNRNVLSLFTVHGHAKGDLLSNLTNAVAVDFHYEEGLVFWTDVTLSNSSIGRMSFKTQDDSFEILHWLPVRHPDGLAVDWAAGNIYWCDKSLDTIEVARLDGSFRKILLKGKLLQEPRALAIDPMARYLFWSDWGDVAHIGRMGMDGSNATLIVKTSLRWPNALALDHVTGHVFWGDAAQDYIGMCDYEGNHRRQVLTHGLKHIFSMAVFEDFLYWTDWEKKRVEKAHKYTGANRTVVIDRLQHRPMGIKVIHPLAQPNIAKYQNPCHDNGWCSNLCLLSPVAPTEYKCDCAQNFKLYGTLECVADCKPSEFVCENTYKCLPLWWRCDGQDDCGDGQDEMYFKEGACPSYNCSAGQFACPGSTADSAVCLHPSRLCDGTRDCPGDQDEGADTAILDCVSYQCLPSQFKCPNSTCIPESSRCDSIKDCLDGADERNCPAVVCEPSQFECPAHGDSNVKCIAATFVCDTDNDCPGGQDELNCKDRKCGPKEFLCPEGRCIPLSWRCDNQTDCKNGTDEQECHSVGASCSQYQFECDDGVCVPESYKCDGELDCPNGSDERDCPSAAVNCSSDHWLCEDRKRCVQRKVLCDGVNDCEDGSDEDKNAECTRSSCSETEFKCTESNECIPKIWKCDGRMDCADGSDEFECSDSLCAAGFYSCDNKRCVPSLWLCDGVDDCGDGSDEDEKCRSRACAPSMMKCSDGFCFPAHLLCDGTNQCKDRSDELNSKCSDVCTNGFRCRNGHCVAKKYRCDSFDDCGDNSDEEQCQKNPCEEFGVCQQKCELTKSKELKCYCEEGYTLEWWNEHRCRADVEQKPYIILASNDRLRVLSSTSNENWNSTELELLSLDGHRVHGVDYLLNNHTLHLYFTDTLNGSIYHTQMRLEDSHRTRRQTVDTTPILSTDGEPRGLAIDWLNANVYWADARHATIELARLDGSVRTTVVSWNIFEPMAVAVNPEQGQLFWSDVGSIPKIEVASLNGASGRRVLVSERLMYPSGLAVDAPNGRLYWADMKTGTIETITLNGDGRSVVKSYGFAKGGLVDRPMFLSVFEDNLYVTGYPKHSLWKEHKFGRRPSQLLTTNKTHQAYVAVAHPLLRKPGSSPCTRKDSFCDKDSVCVSFGSFNLPYCICRTGFSNEHHLAPCFRDYNSSELSKFGISCGLKCENGGHCVLAEGRETCACALGFGGARCQNDLCHSRCLNGGKCQINQDRQTVECLCPHEYDGDRCERFKCAEHCSAHGLCYLLQNGLPDCRCDHGWTGDRCQSKEDLCRDYCFNGGECTPTNLGRQPHCACEPGFTGPRCEHCRADDEIYTCENGGYCTGNKCTCTVGFLGDHCQQDMCQDVSEHYCMNGGSCVRSESGGLECRCLAGFKGNKCQHDLCDGFCHNGGSCKRSRFGPQCFCPSNFNGTRCEREQSCDDFCLNGATCSPASDGSFRCHCAPGFFGDRCDLWMSCRAYCKNGARCTARAHGRPTCQCPKGLAGDQCDQLSATTCEELDCLYGGVCYQQPRSNLPTCLCLDGWSGAVCALATCNNYCLHGGICQLIQDRPWCSCPKGWRGDRCDIFDLESAPPINDTIASVVVPLIVLILIVLLVLHLLFVRRKRSATQFKHTRMLEPDEMENPVFMHGEQEGDALVDEVTNFSNPMYDTVYNDTVTSASMEQEQHGLLASAKLEIRRDDGD